MWETLTSSFGITGYENGMQSPEMKFVVRMDIPILIGSRIMILEKTYTYFLQDTKFTHTEKLDT
jgi:hypothetical protein